MAVLDEVKVEPNSEEGQWFEGVKGSRRTKPFSVDGIGSLENYGPRVLHDLS